MTTILALITILAVGYLSAHFLFGKLQSRYFFTSGIEYIILGVLIGPHVTQLMTPDIVGQLGPVMSLALGSIGLQYGLQLRFRGLARMDAQVYQLAFLEVLTTFVLVGGVFGFLFWYLQGPGDTVAILSGALVLGATAAVSAPTALDVVRRRFNVDGPLYDSLRFLVGFDELLGIVIFGFIFCFLRVGQTSGIRPLTTTEWVAVNIVFGILLGILFFLFLGREKSQEKLQLALIGIVIFSSGTAYYLNLSPLFINLVLGIMLANTSRIRKDLLEILLSVEKPFYVVLLVFAGAAWEMATSLSIYLVVALVGVYVLLRYAGKFLGGYLAHLSAEQVDRSPRRVGLGLLSHGGVAVAMIINYQQVYRNDLTAIVFTCVLTSVIMYELLSPRWTKDLLVDAGEIPRE